MQARTLVHLSALLLLAPALGCAGADGANDSSTSDDKGAFTLIPHVPYVNPCDVGWRLPTADWPSLTPSARELDSTGIFYDFEKRLWSGGSLWFGRSSASGFHRAVVHVDHYLAGSKQTPKSGLWYLALIPYVPPPEPMSFAMNAVPAFAIKPPVDSHVFGYCLDDNSFLPNLWNAEGLRAPSPVMSGQRKIMFTVAEYDPRCTCTAATAQTSAYVGQSLYDSVTSM